MSKRCGNPFRVALLLVACLVWLPQASADKHEDGKAGMTDLRASMAPAAPGGEVKAEDGLAVAARFELLLLLSLGSALLLLASGIKLKLSSSRRVKILRNPLLKN